MKELSSERWQEVDALFDEALKHPPEARLSFLRQACGGDDELFEEVHVLLESDTEAEQRLGESATALVEPLLSGLEAHLEETESQAGPYRLLREIGRGGMGAVYLAERDDDQYQRHVALKLVKQGMDTDEILHRFRYERQILAALEHPNIARLYDGGRTDDGRPFLVMEYVDGHPIDRYSDTKQLSVEERLKLFVGVCEAVQYAHQNLVVHRDLKPSNILVTEKGRVKLLDFGIAKLLTEEEAGVSAPVTRTGVRVLTPEYAAPEQLRGDTITTATDVYALGIVLYELLTGRRPLTGNNQEPERPSTAVTKTTDTVTPEAVSTARATTAERLQRRLRDDLDTILLKALKQEPERRYASAEAFVDDIKRHLAGLPVEAQPDAWTYRLRKFATRNKTAVVVAVAFLVLLLTYATTVTLQSRRIQAERDIAEQERNKAEEVVALFADLFKAADPNVADGDTLNVYQLLEQSEARLEDELADQPDVQATMWTVMGEVYRNMGDYDRAIRLLGNALVIRNEAFGPEHKHVAETMSVLGATHRDNGDYEAAEPLLHQALKRYQASPDASRFEIANATNDLAILYLEKGEYDISEPLYHETLAMMTEAVGVESEEVATVKSALARLYLEKGDTEAAEPLLREALALHKALLGATDPQIAATLTNLAALHQQRGEYAQSEAYMRENLAIRRRTLGDEHPLLVISLGNLATVMRPQGKLDEAETMLREAHTLALNTLGEEHPDVSWILFTMGAVMSDKEDHTAADSLYRQALALDRKLLGNEHPVVALDQTGLANTLQDQGRYTEAETLYQEALALMRSTLPEGHVYLARPLVGLGALLTAQGRPIEAEPILREGLAIRLATSASPETDWTVANARVQLGTCLTAQARHEEAEPLLTTGYQALHGILGPTSKHTRTALQALITLYEAWGQPGTAARYQKLLNDAAV